MQRVTQRHPLLGIERSWIDVSGHRPIFDGSGEEYRVVGMRATWRLRSERTGTVVVLTDRELDSLRDAQALLKPNEAA